jgi:23S rRNA pseudouridine1911/1915/1917 synthase
MTETNQGFTQKEEDSELYEHYRFVVDLGQESIRIDKYLFNRIMNASRNKIQNAAKAENILVNEVAIKPNYKVRPKDVISIVMSEPPRDKEIKAENIPLNIVYEDDSIIVINKKAGMVVHPAYANYDGTLVNALKYHYMQNGVAEEDANPLLVHRIDKNTSGIMLVAKTELAQTALSRLFFYHDIERKYQALVWGDFEEEEGTIEGHIGRDLLDRKRMTVFPDGEYGKKAITHYKVLERFHYVSLVECQLETGRTHQIRAHLKYLKHPLFNDETYGGDKIVKGTSFTKYKQFIQNCFTLIPRQALHAKSLGFVHPLTEEKMFFDSELPEDMQGIVAKWKHYIKFQKEFN